MKIPNYVYVDRSGAICTDVRKYLQSPEHAKHIKDIKKLRKYLKNERKHKKTSNRSCF